MTDNPTPEFQPDARLKMLRCRRTGEAYDTCTHAQCPYCFGEERDVATGDYTKFCDFRKGEDAISFGFPDDSSRHQRG